MPSKYGANLAPGTKQVETLRREWEAEQRAERDRREGEALERIDRKTHNLRAHFLRSIAHDPAKRAAWDLLADPAPWDALMNGGDIGDLGINAHNMTRPSTILLFAGIAYGVAEEDREAEATRLAEAIRQVKESATPKP